MWHEGLRRISWLDGLLGLGILLIATGLGLNVMEADGPKKVELIKGNVVQSNVKVTCDIEGEVVRPGVYQLNSGERLDELLIKAGGLGANADREWVERNLNKARILTDGEKIFIPNKNQISKIKNQKLTQNSKILGAEDTLVNINTAGVEELDKLPGIGPSLAQRIIDYREKNGGFRDINELKLVTGIGEKMYEKIKDKISL